MERVLRRAEFEKELRRMVQLHGIRAPRRPAIVALAFAHESAPDFQNVFGGFDRRAYLLVTGAATYAMRGGLLGLRPDWIVRHAALVADAYHARAYSRGAPADVLVLPLDRGNRVFRMGSELAQYNCEMAAWEINEVRGARPHRSPADPVRAAVDAYTRRDFPAAFLHYAEAVDRLHEVRAHADDALLKGLADALLAAENAAPPDVALPLDVATAAARVLAQLRELATTDPARYRRTIALLEAAL
jgi:hypothetical protein